jgi:hypothetical protein
VIEGIFGALQSLMSIYGFDCLDWIGNTLLILAEAVKRSTMLISQVEEKASNWHKDIMAETENWYAEGISAYGYRVILSINAFREAFRRPGFNVPTDREITLFEDDLEHGGNIMDDNGRERY